MKRCLAYLGIIALALVACGGPSTSPKTKKGGHQTNSTHSPGAPTAGPLDRPKPVSPGAPSKPRQTEVVTEVTSTEDGVSTQEQTNTGRKNTKYSWTKEEITAADTERQNANLSKVERDVFLYMNLARLYPQRFAQIELAFYPFNSQESNKHTVGLYLGLIAELMSRQPAPALHFDEQMQSEAECWLKESSDRGVTGHNRKQCSKSYRSEVCAYGSTTGQEIVVGLMIDQGNSYPGHREAILDPSMLAAGAAYGKHNSDYTNACVVDFQGDSKMKYKKVKYTQKSTITQEQYDDIRQKMGHNIPSSLQSSCCRTFLDSKITELNIYYTLNTIYNEVNRGLARDGIKTLRLVEYSDSNGARSGSMQFVTFDFTCSDAVADVYPFILDAAESVACSTIALDAKLEDKVLTVYFILD